MAFVITKHAEVGGEQSAKYIVHPLGNPDMFDKIPFPSLLFDAEVETGVFGAYDTMKEFPSELQLMEDPSVNNDPGLLKEWQIFKGTTTP